MVWRQSVREKKDENWTKDENLCSGETGSPYPLPGLWSCSLGQNKLSSVCHQSTAPSLSMRGPFPSRPHIMCTHPKHSLVQPPKHTPKIHRHTPQTHVLTPPPLPPHSNKKSAFFQGQETRENARSQSKPTSKCYFLPETKTEQKLPIMYPTLFFFPSRKGADIVKSMFLNETKKASNTICDTFISVPG